jgi:hypothetical protein
VSESRVLPLTVTTTLGFELSCLDMGVFYIIKLLGQALFTQ